MSIFLKISWCLPPEVKQVEATCHLMHADFFRASYYTFAREPPGERGQTMGLLRLAVLGPPEIFHDGSRLSFALRKAQALLLYLAVEGGLHSRSKLAALLWPDSEPQGARTALRNAITLLRRLLADPNPSTAPDSLPPGQEAHLLNQGDLIGLNPQ